MVARSGGSEPGPLRLAAHVARDSGGAGVCGVRWGLHRRRAAVAMDRRRHQADGMGRGGRRRRADRHGPHHVSAALTVGKRRTNHRPVFSPRRFGSERSSALSVSEHRSHSLPDLSIAPQYERGPL